MDEMLYGLTSGPAPGLKLLLGYQGTLVANESVPPAVPAIIDACSQSYAEMNCQLSPPSTLFM